MFDWIGGRKTLLALLFIALTTVAMFTGFLMSERWVEALEWCLIVFLGANVAKAFPDALARRNGNGKP